MSREVSINPAILIWARESAGLEVDEAVARLGLTSTEKLSGAEKLARLESGEQKPTRSQLSKIAATYRRPLLTFYLPEPPARGDRGEDFRRAPTSVSPRENALLDTLLRDIRARQEMVRELVQEDDEFTTSPLVGAFRMENGVEAVARGITTALDFENTAAKRAKLDTDSLFKLLRAKADGAGFFVLLVGDLGSHHSALSADVFRGFAIADPVAPFIVINDQDARAARSFTLIHELAHVAIGQSGVSGMPDRETPHDNHALIERFCNDVAGEFLLPDAQLGAKPEPLNSGDVGATHEVIAQIATRWCVSEPMVAYRLNRKGWIGSSVYDQLVANFTARWRDQKQKTRDANKEDEGGPSYYVVRQSKLGNALLEVVRRTLRDHTLTHTKAAKVLGVKPSSVEPLLRGYEKSIGAITYSPARAS